jgi:hypothetical protein
VHDFGDKKERRNDYQEKEERITRCRKKIDRKKG